MKNKDEIKLWVLDYCTKKGIVNAKTIEAMCFAFNQGQSDIEEPECLNRLIAKNENEINHEELMYAHTSRYNIDNKQNREFNLSLLKQYKL
jgi:hypothetical protein